jgi:hypothetical protein
MPADPYLDAGARGEPKLSINSESMAVGPNPTQRPSNISHQMPGAPPYFDEEGNDRAKVYIICKHLDFGDKKLIKS